MKRLVLIDQVETPDYIKYFGCGLGNDIYTLQSIQSNQNERDLVLSIGDGDAVMVVGSEPFKFLRSFFHFGIRSENFSDCVKLRRLSIEGGAFLKCIDAGEVPDRETINDFLSEDFSYHINYESIYNFKQKVLHTYEEAVRFIEYMNSLPPGTNYGLDYETSGMPLEPVFEVSGLSICTINKDKKVSYGGFISLTDIRKSNCTEDQYNDLLKRLGSFLVIRMSNVWTYNMQFEFQVSRRLLGVDLYNLCDSGVFNVLDGNHLLKKYSLKWTANYILESTVWDTEFDRISGIIDKMLFIEVGKLKRDKKKVLKVTRENFKDSEEWAELCSRYPDYVEEFERLILDYWGNPFMCIPSEILGYYCNLDAFYTLLIMENRSNMYSKDAIETFMDNYRLGARLHACGLYINEDFRTRYKNESLKLMAWGITYCATARCKVRMDLLTKTMRNIKNYPQAAQKLMRTSKFFKGNAVDITKYILSSNIDTMDAYELGINEGSLLMTFGQEFSEKFLEIVRDAKIEAKMKTKIDESIVKKKKIIGIIAEKITPILGLDKLSSPRVIKAHNDLEEYLYYETAYLELIKVSNNFLNDIFNIPDNIYAFGNNFNLAEYSKFISDNYFKCASPVENDIICEEFARLFLTESTFLASMFESTQQLNNAEKFYQELNIKTINDAYSHFMSAWEDVVKNGKTAEQTDYPAKVFDLAYQYYNSPGSTQMKEVWSNFNGFIVQEQFFNYVADQFEEYAKPFNDSDFNDNFFFMRKLVINYLLYKKYAKVLSTYIDGMFKANNRWVIEGPDRIPIRYAQPNEPGAVEKCFVHYEINTKSSKRWSSGFHTIISHSDLKDCIAVPPAYDNQGNIIYGGADYIMTYFDISSAEVKAAGYASMDPDLIEKFNNGTDIYIYSAKLYLGEEKWEQLTSKQKKMWRKRFKTIFLGVLYGLGKSSLAERLNSSVEEAEDIIQNLYKSFPKLREYVAVQQKYPLNHNGFINTMLGDKLQVMEYKLLKKATQARDIKSLTARIERLGVNLPIQGGTSAIMSRGFYNNIRTSLNQKWNNALIPIITVHDSNTNLVPVEKIFDIRKFYDIHYTDYCASFGPKIKLLFDLNVGTAYEKAMGMKNIDENTIEFTGSAYSIIDIYDKLMNRKNLNVSCNLTRDQIIPNFVNHPIQRFIMEKGTCIIKDISKYTVRFTRNL